MADNLYLPWRQTDLGGRPINPCGPPPDDPNIAPWLAYCIWMSPPGNPKATQTKAVVGVPCDINVGVLSKEATFTPQATPVPANVTVQVWASNFTLGIGPAGALPSLGTDGGSDDITATLSGRPATMTDAANHWQVATISWTPLETDRINQDAQGEGHICLAANVFWIGTTPPAEGQHLTSGSLQVCADQHHAQRNIGVLKAGSEVPIVMAMMIQNPEIEEDIFQIEVLELRGAKAVLGKAGRAALLAEDFVEFRAERGAPARPGRPHRRPPRDLKDDSERPPHRPVEWDTLEKKGKLVLAEDRKIELTAARGPVKEVALESEHARRGGQKIKLEVPGEGSRDVALNIQLSARERPGTVRAFDVIQRRGRRIVGGARIHTVRL